MVPPLIENSSAGVTFHEQIYTSAERLLESSTGHLGVVASTRNFPRELAAVFEPVRSYTMLPAIPADQPALHPSRLVLGPGGNDGQWYCITQVAFAGADHTGRTTPIAHHVALSQLALAEESIAPASALRMLTSTFARKWREAPRWIEPPRTLSGSEAGTSNGAMKTAGDSIEQKTLFAIVDAVLHFALAHRPVVVAVDSSDPTAAPRLITSVLELLPPSVQRTTACASHVVDRSEVPRNCALVTTYTEAPYWQQLFDRADNTRPLMWNLASPAIADANHARSGYAQALAEASIGGRDFGPTDQLDVPRLWDELTLQIEDVSLFPGAARIVHLLSTSATLDDVATISRELENLNLAKPSQSLTRQLALRCEQFVQRLATKPGSSACVMLCRIAADAAWPPAIQSDALRVLIENGDRSVPTLLEQPESELLSQKTLYRILSRLVAERPQIVMKVVKHAIKKPSLQTSQWAAKMLSLADANADQLLEWSLPLLQADRGVQDATLPVIHGLLNMAAPEYENMVGVVETCKRADFSSSPIVEKLVQPLLKSRVECIKGDTWPDYALLWLDGEASQCRLVPAVEQLASHSRNLITQTMVQQIRAMALNGGVAQELDAVLFQHQLVAPPPIANAEYALASARELPASQNHSGRVVQASRRTLPKIQGGWRAVGPVFSVGVVATVVCLLVAVVFCIAPLALQNSVSMRSTPLTIVLSTVAVAMALVWCVVEACMNERVLSVVQRSYLRLARFTLLLVLSLATLTLITIVTLGVAAMFPEVEAEHLAPEYRQYFFDVARKGQ